MAVLDLELEVLAAPSELGWLAVAVCRDRVCGVSFGHQSQRQATTRVRRVANEKAVIKAARRVKPAVAAWDASGLLDRLAAYASGGADSFADVPVLLGEMTMFQRRVVAACRAIRCGETRTYGELAATAGSPGAARAVGQVMAANRIPLIVPCHRVVAASGRLGGFSAPQGVAMKRRLLAMEGATAGAC